MNKNTLKSEVNKRFKMYKVKKHWVVAPIIFFGIITGAIRVDENSVYASDISHTINSKETQ
ncbi:KxYKxGKxW signal peptide domain-containing protein, partial [Enterococcus faecium]|nr:KxYKxGKxW signal peptide domain-containing protein [Enterococcus faecium]